MSFVLFAYSDMGYACLEELLKCKQDILLLVTHPYDESSALQTPETLAKKHNIPITYINNSDELYSLSFNENPDFILSCYFKYIIPSSILQCAKLASLNFHGSLLPKYRGRCPLNWAIINGEKETGVTLHHMVEKVDAGDIVDSEKIDILLTDTAGDVMQKMISALRRIINRQIPLLKGNRIARIPMNFENQTYYGGRTIKDSEIDWNKSSLQIHNLIRALQPSPPYPAAWAITRFGKILCFEAEILPEAQNIQSTPGEMTIQNDTIFASCGTEGKDRLKITKFKIE
jgi:methionyl-tRNA formyltransferase